ncbi:MAG: alpha/beta hydrolase [Planctomycetaceae bacterium]
MNQTVTRVLSLVIVGLLRSAVVVGADGNAVPENVTVVYNLRYREGPSNSWMLDLAMPREKPNKPRAAIVVIHGGGWIEGDKSSFSVREKRMPGNIIDFARLGFVAVTINYRLSGEAAYPAALDDCRCAVRWLRAHADEYHIDRARIGAYGNSAGGHLALLLAMASKDVELKPDEPWREYSSRVQAAVSDSGPLDLVHQYEQETLRKVVAKFLGGPPDNSRLADYQRASPVNHISKNAPPLLLIYGVADNQVPVETADRFVTALGEAGLKDVSYHRLAGVDHCPHSLQKVEWLKPVVNEFFLRTLKMKE